MHKLYRPLFLAVMILCICLTSCSKKHTERESVSESPTPSEQTHTSEPTASEPPTEMPVQAASSPVQEDAPIDIDLTQFNANMLYAEVYNMGMSPKNYKGKMIKLTGEFAHFPKYVDREGNPTSDEQIYVCIVSDAMACCAAGVEFIPEKESSFWINFPEDGSKITVTGLCDIFLDESGLFMIIQLDNATVEPSN